MSDNGGFCITCQRRYANRSAHKKGHPGHIIHRETASIDAAERAETEATADDVLSSAVDEQATQKPTKKLSGADFASQPLFIATAGVGLGLLTAKAFGEENALHQEEAQGIAAGLLRIAGRHLLKEVDMEALSQANGDINDLVLIGRSVANYIARKWSERQRRKEQESPAQAGPASPNASHTDAHTTQTDARNMRNGHTRSVEDEAAMMQQAWAGATMSMPDFGFGEAA